MASRRVKEIAARGAGARMTPFSEASYLAASAPPRRIVLCPAGVSVAGDLAFLERVAARLLWSAPPERMADAIGGIRGEGMPGRRTGPIRGAKRRVEAGAERSEGRGSKGEAARAGPREETRGEEIPAPSRSRRASTRPRRACGPALLLEGVVDAARARAALRASSTRDWIVESAARVRIGPRVLSVLAREGVRWAALDPIVVVALYASPELARRQRTWRALLPARTPVWIRGGRTPRRRPGRV